MNLSGVFWVLQTPEPRGRLREFVAVAASRNNLGLGSPTY